MVQLITKAIQICGLKDLASACDVTAAAVLKWQRYGLPLTEWHRPRHVKAIERATQGKVTAKQLLATTPRVVRTQRLRAQAARESA